MKKWESEKHKNWSMPAEDFKGQVVTDGSLLGTAGKWRARVWSVNIPIGGRHRKAQALPLSGVARIKAGHSRILQKVGAQGEHVEERMEVAKSHSRAPSH